MSKYYKAEDVTELINACEWRMTLAKERHGEGFVDYSKQILDVDELTKRLSNLPTIDIVHCKDCKHRYVTGVTTQYYVCDFMDAEYMDDGYCHRGERIDNE